MVPLPAEAKLSLSGAARAAAEHKVLRDYAENLLAGLLVGIPEIYKEIELCN